MAGRGRKGKTGTLTVDQMAALGYVKNLPPKALGQAKVKKLPEFNYKTMPKELNMSNTKRHGEDPQPKMLAKKTNIEESLKVLEQTELKTGDEHDDAEKEQDDAESEQDDAEKESDMEQDDEMDDPESALDHEMDDENDYGNSYFDNGEDYSEEDDNLSDGPVI
ncbi:GL26517 [Drosophila persimilis]|uniref:GL26517 n=1 Tax=Drosophila persimilis TaxID=7234 RepID=B4GSD0_DROPE|nr:GL26517 [Drosophila persimilis]